MKYILIISVNMKNAIWREFCIFFVVQISNA